MEGCWVAGWPTSEILAAIGFRITVAESWSVSFIHSGCIESILFTRWQTQWRLRFEISDRFQLFCHTCVWLCISLISRCFWFRICHLTDECFACRQSAPGQAECEAAVHSIDGWIHHLDQASLAAVGQSLSPQHDGSLAGFQEQVIASARQLQQQVEPIRHAAKGETGHLERYVCFLCAFYLWRTAKIEIESNRISSNSRIFYCPLITRTLHSLTNCSTSLSINALIRF